MEDEFDNRIHLNGVYSVREYWATLPCLEISYLSEEIQNALTGPDLGFQRILASEDRSSLLPYVAGTNNWSLADEGFYGVSMSLYDQNPFTYKITADPNADCFGLCKRGNNSVLVICDGVNRGNKSRMAARSAAYGALRYINAHCFEQGEQPMNTHDIFALLKEALMAAHACVLKNVHWCTTICIAFIVPLASDPNTHAVCTINVGDSYTFLARRLKEDKGESNCQGDVDNHEQFLVEELTITSHDFSKDVGRETGGAIGPVTPSDEPLLSNLTYSMAYAQRGDIVFLTTDGVSDNFDPVVQRLQSITRAGAHGDQNIAVDVKSLTLKDRHAVSLQCMQAALNNFAHRSGETLTASSLCGELMRHALLMSQDKRAVLEDPEIYSGISILNRKSIEKVQKSPEVKSLLANTRGKMDHASICAVTIAHQPSQKSTMNKITNQPSNSEGDSFSLRRFTSFSKNGAKNYKKKRASKLSLP